jgi:class 3 adenylate cyclase
MSRIDCVSNRNIKIIATYVNSKVDHHEALFDGIPYPAPRYTSPEDFFLNEDEWTTFENYQLVFRKAREMVGEPHFYFNCGASPAYLRSWGRFDYFARVFASPGDGFKRLGFFNKNFTDTSEIEVVIKPSYDRASGKMRTVLKVEYHSDMDVQKDYVSDPYRRGIISSIPTIWGLSPAMIKQPLNAFDPEILFKEEPEFAQYGLDAKMDGDLLTIRHPADGQRKTVGAKVLIEPELVGGQKIFLGRYSEPPGDYFGNPEVGREALLITETVKVDNRILLKKGEIYKAPYFILDVTFDNLSLVNRLTHVFRFRRNHEESEKGLIDTIDRLRETVETRNEAYYELEKSNAELKEAKRRVDDYAKNLEQKVKERTAELSKAKEELELLNRNLEAKVVDQVEQLERFNELTRYLSPKLAEKILSSGDALGARSKRKMMTVMFSDIRNFSALTDSIEPEEIFHLLDMYLSEMTKIIHQYDGTLNKIIGDGLLVFFGDPIPTDDHAQRAVMMAIEMQKKVADMRDEWLLYGHELGIGIGINTGYVSVGNIGSDIHRDYTVIGNQVNITARLESQAKSGQILISQRTYSRVKDLVEAERVGKIQVKGIHAPVVTYNVKVL